VKFIYRNDIITNTQLHEGEVNCLLVNTTGELRFFTKTRRWCSLVKVSPPSAGKIH